jgi:hypothetical protein
MADLLRIFREAAAYESSDAALEAQARADCMAVAGEHEGIEAAGFELLLAEDVRTFLRAHDLGEGR